jgi:3-isopropylmalate/(R)-2-methylmalate dehydratase large subunit
LSDEGPRTLFEKIWRRHLVAEPEDPRLPSTLYVDLHLVHEVTSPQAFALLRERGLGVRRPDRTFATMDHSTPTLPAGTDGSFPIADPTARAQLERLAQNCETFGIRLAALGDPRRGIVHVIGPELGLTQPGMTIACGDSHTSTHGAFGAFAFGIGTTAVGHVLATQATLYRRPRTFEIRIDGRLPSEVSAKDLILAIIAEIGTEGGTGHVLEYRGEAVRALDMEQRMTLCNMSIEAGARAGMIAPDDTTFEYVCGRPHAPRGQAWDSALARWRLLPSDSGARFDASLTLEGTAIEPMITYGTSPGMAIPVRGIVPESTSISEAPRRETFERAVRYMGVEPGKPILGRRIDVVFVGSCTNGRISDLREVARILDGRKVAENVKMLIVPGSQQIKAQAEAEGLAEVFHSAGAEWRESGCSLCLAMNDDRVPAGHYAVSTSNRNFEGRQGAGARTFLASPATATASAVRGEIADPREFSTGG